jgi:hypothetical protein
MSVDGEIAVEILRDIRGEMRGMRGELVQMRGDLVQVRDEVRQLAETTNRRLETIEHTLVDFCQQHPMLARYVGNAERRQDDDIQDLRSRVEQLERGQKS